MKTKTQHAAAAIAAGLESLAAPDFLRPVAGLDGEELWDVHQEIDALLADPMRLLPALAEAMGVEFEQEWRIVDQDGQPVTLRGRVNEATATSYVTAAKDQGYQRTAEYRYTLPWTEAP